MVPPDLASSPAKRCRPCAFFTPTTKGGSTGLLTLFSDCLKLERRIFVIFGALDSITVPVCLYRYDCTGMVRILVSIVKCCNVIRPQIRRVRRPVALLPALLPQRLPEPVPRAKGWAKACRIVGQATPKGRLPERGLTQRRRGANRHYGTGAAAKRSGPPTGQPGRTADPAGSPTRGTAGRTGGDENPPGQTDSGAAAPANQRRDHCPINRAARCYIAVEEGIRQYYPRVALEFLTARIAREMYEEHRRKENDPPVSTASDRNRRAVRRITPGQVRQGSEPLARLA